VFIPSFVFVARQEVQKVFTQTAQNRFVFLSVNPGNLSASGVFSCVVRNACLKAGSQSQGIGRLSMWK